MRTIQLEAVLWTIDRFGDADDAACERFDAPLLDDGRLDLAAIPDAAVAAVALARHIGYRPRPYRLIVGTLPDDASPSLPLASLRLGYHGASRTWEFAALASARFAEPMTVAA